MKNIPGTLKEKLKESFIIDIPKIVEVYESNVDDTKKLLSDTYSIKEEKLWEDIFFIKGEKIK